MIQTHCRWLSPFWFFLLLLAGCERQKAPAPPAAEEKAKTAEVQTVRAAAELKPTEGSTVNGTVTFTSENGAVRVVAAIEGLEPGPHGFHVHESGDCSAPDASSAGGHFNPGGTPHGSPDAPSAQRHVGDLGNVEADAAGKAHYERRDPVISLAGPNSVVGKAVIVHARADDLTSQPTGEAGPRLACGIIQTQE